MSSLLLSFNQIAVPYRVLIAYNAVMFKLPGRYDMSIRFQFILFLREQFVQRYV